MKQSDEWQVNSAMVNSETELNGIDLPRLRGTVARRRKLFPELGVMLLAGLAGLMSLPAGVFANDELRYPEYLFPQLYPLLQSAVDISSRMEIQRALVEEREGQYQESRSANRPRVGLYGRVAMNYEIREDIENKTRPLVNANLTVNQPLWYWGDLEARKDIGKLRLDAAKAEMERSQIDHLNQLRQTYLRWVMVQHKISSISQSIEFSQNRVTSQRELVDIGRSTEQVILELEVRVQEHRENLAVMQREKRRLENLLRLQTGLNGSLDSFFPNELPEIEPMDLNQLEMLRRRLLNNQKPQSKELERRELELAVEKRNWDVLDKRHYPKVDLIAGAFADQLDGVNESERVMRGNFFVGFSVNWNIFDGLQSRGMKMSSLARQRVQQLVMEDSRAMLDSEAERLFGELELNIKQILTRDTRSQILEQRLALMERQRERELISFTDLLEVELYYQDVGLQAMEARFNYIINLLNLASLYSDEPIAMNAQ